MQTLIYLGRDAQAMQFADRARAIFEKEVDQLRLARLDSNVGNIFYRQDKYADARNRYRNAFERLTALKRPQDAAAVLSNMAVASTGLGDFETAAAEYRESRLIAEREGMSSLAAEIDYNVAYLHFLRGDYTRALALYREARRHSAAIGDEYHGALCDLDQAEVYLDLNLIEESNALAQKAASGFEGLRMDYERAKALMFLGASEHRRRNTTRALILFAAARRLFTAARNPIWPAIIDLYRSILLRDLGQMRPAFKIARRAGAVFASEGLESRQVLAKLLLAEMHLDRKDLDRALNCLKGATQGLNASDHPMVFYHAENLKGRILRAQGDTPHAYSAFLQAAELFESVRCRLAGDELKVAFAQNKLETYSSLMLLARELLPATERESAMFDFIERSKSRSLADRAVSTAEIPLNSSAVSEQLLAIRQELNALYRQIDFRQAERRDSRALWERARAFEHRLKSVVTENSVDSVVERGIADWTPVSLETLSGTLPRNARMIEFFVAEGRLWVGVMGGGSVRFKELGDVEPIHSAIRFLMFQITKMQHQARPGRPDVLGQTATLAHLRTLYTFIIKPIESWIDVDELAIVPHGLLHQLPFHALHDGAAFLIDRASISYAPSATVFSLCANRICHAPPRSLLMGLPDERNPAIAEEIECIARLLPEPSIFLGERATENVLFERGGGSRYIHIAAHSQFRRDNPIFSWIRLGDARINVLDLYRLKLDAELVTLSGCSTGVGAVFGGDELVGLARGLMHAGTRSVLLTLWDIHDASTARFMTYFYKNLALGESPARALRQAVLLLRQEWPEPYSWAPFVVSGYGLGPCTR